MANEATSPSHHSSHQANTTNSEDLAYLLEAANEDNEDIWSLSDMNVATTVTTDTTDTPTATVAVKKRKRAAKENATGKTRTKSAKNTVRVEPTSNPVPESSPYEPIEDLEPPLYSPADIDNIKAKNGIFIHIHKASLFYELVKVLAGVNTEFRVRLRAKRMETGEYKAALQFHNLNQQCTSLISAYMYVDEVFVHGCNTMEDISKLPTTHPYLQFRISVDRLSRFFKSCNINNHSLVLCRPFETLENMTQDLSNQVMLRLFNPHVPSAESRLSLPTLVESKYEELQIDTLVYKYQMRMEIKELLNYVKMAESFEAQFISFLFYEDFDPLKQIRLIEFEMSFEDDALAIKSSTILRSCTRVSDINEQIMITSNVNNQDIPAHLKAETVVYREEFSVKQLGNFLKSTSGGLVHLSFQSELPLSIVYPIKDVNIAGVTFILATNVKKDIAP
jgi:hypothetical protein